MRNPICEKAILYIVQGVLVITLTALRGCSYGMCRWYWWKIRRGDSHTYKIHFLFQTEMTFTETLRSAEEGPDAGEEECMPMNHTVHLHTQTKHRHVQTMLWRSVSSICSCKHFCDVDRLHFFRWFWMNVRHVFHFFVFPTLYSNRDWSEVEGVCGPDAMAGIVQMTGEVASGPMLASLSAPFSRFSFLLIHAARQLSAFFEIKLCSDEARHTRDTNTKVSHNHVFWKLLPVIFQIAMYPIIPTV